MKLLTTAEAAERLAISARTLRREIAEGRLAVIRIGRLVRFRVEDLDAYRRGMAAKPAWWPRVWQWSPDHMGSWTQEPWPKVADGCRASIIAGSGYWLRSLDTIERAARPPAEWDYNANSGGVYFWFRDRELRYIGIASEYTRRFAQHQSDFGVFVRGWNRVSLLPLWRDAALAVEGFYIRTLAPPDNAMPGDGTLWDWNP